MTVEGTVITLDQLTDSQIITRADLEKLAKQEEFFVNVTNNKTTEFLLLPPDHKW